MNRNNLMAVAIILATVGALLLCSALSEASQPELKAVRTAHRIDRANVIMPTNTTLAVAVSLAVGVLVVAVTIAGIVVAVSAGAASVGGAAIVLSKARREALQARLIHADANGLYPVMMTAQGPMMLNEQGAQRLSAFGHAGGRLKELPTQAQPALEAAVMPPETPVWPQAFDLVSHCAANPPTLNALVLGVGIDGAPLTLSLHDLMHTLVVGASGFGKSTWLRALLYQLALVREPVSIVGIDLYGSALNALAGWEKLRWPVARDADAAARLLTALTAEIARRRELYAAHPTVENIHDYNRVAAEALEPVVLICDEGTATMALDGIGAALREVVQTARQYGVYVVVAGQSANARVIETQTRDNFSTRLAFRVPRSSSRVVLDDGRAADLDVPGRALLQSPGRALTEILGPRVGRREFLRAFRRGPVGDIPQAVHETPQEDDLETLRDRARAMRDEGASQRSIEQELFGFTGGKAYSQVKALLNGH